MTVLANEYLTVGGIAVTHDDAGNLTGDHRGYVYEYDMENRLTTVRQSDTTVVATFEYDALGRRIEKVDAIAQTTRRYYYDDQRVAVQTLVSGGVETDDRYFVFGSYIDEVLVMHDGTDDLYYAHDHLYSPTVMFMPNGTVVERYEYDAYGQVQILTSAFSPLTSSQYANPYAFTGRELDTLDAGSWKLYHYRARTYDPDTGRFMQRDPLATATTLFGTGLLAYTDGFNLYEYVVNNPIAYSDPYGWRSVDIGSLNVGQCLSDDEIFKTGFSFKIGELFSLEINVTQRRQQNVCKICCPQGGHGLKYKIKDTRIASGGISGKGTPIPLPFTPGLTITPKYGGSFSGGGTIDFEYNTCDNHNTAESGCWKARGTVSGGGCIGFGAKSPIEGCLTVSCVADYNWGEGCAAPGFRICCRLRGDFCVKLGFWKSCWSKELMQYPSGCGLLTSQ